MKMSCNTLRSSNHFTCDLLHTQVFRFSHMHAPPPRQRSWPHCCILHRQLTKRFKWSSLNRALQLGQQALNSLALCTSSIFTCLPSEVVRWWDWLIRGSYYAAQLGYAPGVSVLPFPVSWLTGWQFPLVYVKAATKAPPHPLDGQKKELKQSKLFLVGVGSLFPI